MSILKSVTPRISLAVAPIFLVAVVSASLGATGGGNWMGRLGLGPREIEDGFIGGQATNPCSCNAEGAGQPCPARSGQTCDKTRYWCYSTGGTNTKYCAAAGNYNYCGGDYCQVSGVAYCSGSPCY